MAADFRILPWRFVGLIGLVALYLSQSWLSARVGHAEALSLLLIVPMLAAFAGAITLMFYERTEPSRPLLQAEEPADVPIAPPRWSPLFFMLQGALLTLSLDGSLGETAGRLAFFGFLAGNVWFGMYRQSQRRQPA